MADEQDIVDALTDLRQIMQQVAQAQSQTAQAVAQLARSGGARAGGVNAGPQNPNSALSRLKARVKNQTERSLSIGIARSLLGPGQQLLGGLQAGIGAGVSGIGTGSSFFSRVRRGFVNATPNIFGFSEAGESVVRRAQSSVAATNEAIVRAGGRISPEALDFQNRVALLRERRVQAFRDAQEGRFTELSGTERGFQGARRLGIAINGEAETNRRLPMDAGLDLEGAMRDLAQAMRDRANGGGRH